MPMARALSTVTTDPAEGVAQSARLCLGVVTGAQGVRGQVRIKSFTAEPNAIADYGPLEDERGTRRFELELVGEAKGVLIARIAGIADRNAAEGLKGLRLYVPRAALPATDPDEFYYADLVGLAAMLKDGSVFGTVAAVHDFGAGASLEIALPDGKSTIIPFTGAAVPVVDVAGGRIVVDPPHEEDVR